MNNNDKNGVKIGTREIISLIPFNACLGVVRSRGLIEIETCHSFAFSTNTITLHLSKEKKMGISSYGVRPCSTKSSAHQTIVYRLMMSNLI